MKQYHIEWSRRAQRDLLGIQTYIAKDNPMAARQVAMALIEAAESLARFPHRGRHGLREGTRELIIPGWPWLIIYRQVGNVVSIISVQHAAQHRAEEE